MVVGGVAAEFFLEGFVVGAAGLDEIEVGGFVHFLAGIGGGKFRLELGEEALVEGGLEGDGVEGKSFGVSLVFDFCDEGVEEIGGAAMGGEDFEAAAPSDAGIGDGVELAGVFVEGEFVEDAVAAFAGLGIGIAGHGMDAAAIGEAKHVGGGAVGGDDDVVFKDGRSGGEQVGEVLAVFEEEAGLGVVAAGDPGVGRGAVEGFAGDQGGSGGPGPADLAGFFGDFETGRVGDPFGLVGKEKSAAGDDVLGASAVAAGKSRWGKVIVAKLLKEGPN